MAIAVVSRVRLAKSGRMAPLLILTIDQVLDREGIQEADRLKAAPVIGLAQVPWVEHQQVLEPQVSQEAPTTHSPVQVQAP